MSPPSALAPFGISPAASTYTARAEPTTELAPEPLFHRDTRRLLLGEPILSDASEPYLRVGPRCPVGHDTRDTSCLKACSTHRGAYGAEVEKGSARIAR